MKLLQLCLYGTFWGDLYLYYYLFIHLFGTYRDAHNHTSDVIM